ncbi:ubiquitin carboxyl-terminal hydrolase calypso-like [Macrosteles quadrilineatus]|uniref:ubiquitin carboxyl-terminal hydrolase calypso-like n=1 Tax=Macrosteles quadrilineatus TaxID=74068 RepID=UPI0023E155F0|nr:ubiquitin carboxyl-terminal hydrolase calypso-like [Macrosteles quadrilineatus]
MPVDINRLTEGWLELESDPGLFTLLLEDFGVKGVQVEEIYDLQKSLDSPVYGFIFLFRWIEERRSRRKVVDQSDIYVKDEEIVNNIFFAQQMVPNSCATHSLLSVLLNCHNIHLGSTLSRLKAHTHGMCPENKGWAIGNTPELARAHNSHAMPQAKRRLDKSTGISTGRFTGEAYHFVSYVPINGRLFELDGLKPFPMDHGPWNESEDWTDKFHSVIADRLGIAAGDIRFNLMAVVPDKRLAITHKLNMLKTNRQIVLEALQQLVKLNHPDLAVKPEKDSKGKSEDTKVSPGSKRKESNKAIENGLDSLASIEDALDLVTPNKIPRKQHSPRKHSNTEDKEEKAEKSEDTDENLKTSPVNSCESLERHNLSKISLIVTSDENEQIKPEISETSKAGEKMPDYSTPLTIQTSPAPSTSSTDTSSEVGSAFNSPTQAWGWNSGQSSPNNAKDFKKFVVIRVAMAGSEEKMDSPTKSKRDSLGVRKVCLDAGALPKGWEKPSSGKVSGMKISPLALSNKLKSDESGKKIETPHHTFAPKDLLALLKNLEGEISLCEGNLRDENEKRKKYKVDDCRRTHNYDEFICTFLSMLAQQGKLADLVQQHLMFQKKPGITPPRPPVVKPAPKKHDSKNHSAKRRKGGSKHRKRK